MKNNKAEVDDKRALERKQLVYYLKVFDRRRDEVLGKLKDVTPEGIMLTSEFPIEVNVRYQLRMVLPPEFSEKQFLVFDAKSLWCRQNDYHDIYDTGFILIDVSPADKSLIAKLIREFGSQE
jgi:hypothetical protein